MSDECTDYSQGFGLVTGFIGLVENHDCTSQTTITHTLMPSVMVFTALFGNGFQR
jgi:hypothetical protein